MDNIFFKLRKDVIMVVDDQPNNLKVIGSVLGEEYTISIANNGRNALKLLDNFLPDLILLDIMMPEMDGYEVCKKLKENFLTKDIPVIFLTAKTDIADIVKGFECGGVDYITKPFNPLEVKVRVKNHLKLYHSEKALIDRDQILHSLISASELFLNTSEWEKNIELVLKQFTDVLNISNIRIFENDTDEKLQPQVNLKIAVSCGQSRKVDEKKALQLNCKTIDLGEWLGELRQNKPVWGTASSENSNELFDQMKARSVLIIPIFVDEEFWGIIEFDDQNAERVWSDQEIETLMLVGNIIGAAIKRTSVERKLKDVYDSLLNELDLASSVQQFLLPNWAKNEDNLIFSSTYKPHNKIGGDFFDYHKISDTKYVAYVGDVSGHGVQAALIMTAVKSIINMLISNEKENLAPYLLVNRLNKVISKGMLGSNYLTFIICLIDLEKKEIRSLSAGHPPIIGYNVKSLKSRILTDHSTIPVGWLKDFEYTENDESTIPLEDGEIYLIYTDGLFECEDDAGEQLGLNRITDFINDSEGDLLCLQLPHIIRQKLVDNHYNIDLDDFTIAAFSTKERLLSSIGRDFYVIQATYANSSKLAQACSEKVRSVTGNSRLADKTEIVANVFLNNIIQITQNKKSFDLVAVELNIEEDVCLKFINRGGKLEIPGNNVEQEIDLLKDVKNLGLIIVQSLTNDISYLSYSEIFETRICIDAK